MKKQITCFAIALAILALGVTARAQVDLTMKGGVYLTGTKLSIDPSSDRFVAKGTRVDVFSDQAVGFENGVYTFNMGVVALRTSPKPYFLSTNVLFKTPAVYVGNTVNFGYGRGQAHYVVGVKLKSGGNRVVVLIDPDQKKIESDETNNTFWIDVVVNQRFPSAGPK